MLLAIVILLEPFLFPILNTSSENQNKESENADESWFEDLSQSEKIKIKEIKLKLPPAVAGLLKQRGLKINWDQFGQDEFTDQDASILRKMLEGGSVTPDDDPDEIFKELVFDSDGDVRRGQGESAETMETLVKTKKGKM